MLNSNNVKVKIDKDAECNICNNLFKNQPLQENFNKKDAFYTALGCMITNWTLNAIYNFVKYLSIFQPLELYGGLWAVLSSDK